MAIALFLINAPFVTAEALRSSSPPGSGWMPFVLRRRDAGLRGTERKPAAVAALGNATLVCCCCCSRLAVMDRGDRRRAQDFRHRLEHRAAPVLTATEADQTVLESSG